MSKYYGNNEPGTIFEINVGRQGPVIPVATL